MARCLEALKVSPRSENNRKAKFCSISNAGRKRLDAETDVVMLNAFGLFSVTAMLVCYAFEKRSPWFILAFALSCVLGSVYGFLQGAWPFGIVEVVWAGVALRRWRLA